MVLFIAHQLITVNLFIKHILVILCYVCNVEKHINIGTYLIIYYINIY